jgi:hypothetical protein
MAGKDDAVELLGVGEKFIEHLRPERPSRNEVVDDERHHDRALRAALVESVEGRLETAQHEIGWIGVQVENRLGGNAGLVMSTPSAVSL